MTDDVARTMIVTLSLKHPQVRMNSHRIHSRPTATRAKTVEVKVTGEGMKLALKGPPMLEADAV